ncbi:hypothetical protein [Pseudomonas akapageensis]|uniref:hypothetical protein n=1 Tax=Pseudomonas akapageensis TaxID=2609961 RepID=UPI0014084447|nr:hypothetical protein [Pseudomonas akapageensis]
MFTIHGVWFPLIENPGVYKGKKYKVKFDARSPGGQLPFITSYGSLSIVAAASSGVTFDDEARAKSLVVGPHWSTLECDIVVPDADKPWKLYFKTGLLGYVEIQDVRAYLELEFGEGGGEKPTDPTTTDPTKPTEPLTPEGWFKDPASGHIYNEFWYGKWFTDCEKPPYKGGCTAHSDTGTGTDPEVDPDTGAPIDTGPRKGEDSAGVKLVD